jgi:hypothetical protein
MPPLRALAEASSPHQPCERHHDRQFAVANRDAAFCESEPGGNGLGRHLRIKRRLDPERAAAGDHHVAVLKPDEAAVHSPARQDHAALAFAAVAVPAEDVRGHLSGRTALTNTTPSPLARLQQRPHRDPQSRSAARH